MKYLKKYESSKFSDIAIDIESIFLELRDRNIKVEVRITSLYNAKFVPIKDDGVTVTIISPDKMKLSDIMYNYIYTSIDYARANGIEFRAIRFDSSIRNMKDYFYEFMMGEEPDISFNRCWISFR